MIHAHPRLAFGLSALLLAFGGELNAQARTFHVCNCGFGAEAACVPGNDLDAGTEQAPLRSLERARQLFPNLRNGDSIRLCRGGAWQLGSETGTLWENSGCRALPTETETAPCEIGSYLPSWGGIARPYLERLGNEAVLELADPLQQPDDYVRLSDLRVARAGVLGVGLLIHPSRNFVDLVDLEIVGHEVGVRLPAEGCDASGSCAYNYRRLRVSGGELIRNGSHALRAEGSPALSVQLDTVNLLGNGLDDPAGAGLLVRGISAATVLGSRFSQTGSLPAERCATHSLRIEAVAVLNLLDNLFDEVRDRVDADCIPVRYSGGGGFGLNLLVGNRFNEFGAAAMWLSNCRNCFVQNNVLVRSIDMPGVGISLQDSAAVAASRGVWMRHNSMFIASTSPFIAVALSVRPDPLVTQGHLSVSSNAVFYAGASPQFRCWQLQARRSDFTGVDYNHCHFPAAESAGARWGDFFGAPPTKTVAMEKGAPSALEVWWSEVNANSPDPPWDRHSTTEDPGFAQSPDPYARLGLMPRFATDVAVDGGEPLANAYITTDFRGRQRDALPDAGAFEYDPRAFDEVIFLADFE